MTDDGTDAARRWRSSAEVADLFDGPEDPEWVADRDRIADELQDPWQRAAQEDQRRTPESRR
ncbi:hypothetical protein ACIA48_02075 [Mycobacterium sp. NPDC051804]|uniref:hypothetical protein n=1 Tax=Mycobacterium sp. NPDC051804 TaxID=3364295 RepID=UPI00379E4942